MYQSKKVMFLVTSILAISMALNSCVFKNNESRFSPAGEEFHFSVTSSIERQSAWSTEVQQDEAILMKIADSTNINGKSFQTLSFHTIATDRSIHVDINVDPSDFVIGQKYSLVYQVIKGFPSGYGLAISENNKLLFMGITDWTLGGNIHVQDLFTFKIQPPRLLEKNVVFGNECWSKITNELLEFSQDSQKVSLVQGQQASLGDYEVNLLVAQKIDYNSTSEFNGVETCTDNGFDGISFLIYQP